MTCTIQKANFLRQLFSEKMGCVKGTVTLKVDNQGAITLAKNPVHQRSMDIDIRYHFIHSIVENGILNLK